MLELHLYKTFSCERSMNVYKHLSGVCCLKRILSWIHKDNALPGAGPMCSAVPHYHTIWWRSHLTLHGLKLPHCWQTAVEFYSSATSGNCVCISFFCLSSFGEIVCWEMFYDKQQALGKCTLDITRKDRDGMWIQLKYFSVRSSDS